MNEIVEKAEQKLKSLEDEVAKTKRFINTAYELAGQTPPYPDVDRETRPVSGKIRKDQWYGRPLATVVREILEMRQAANLGAASIDEIFDALKSGGFEFEFKDKETAKRGVGISLAKNTSVFHRLPSGSYGLAAWYPNVKKPKKTGAGENGQPGSSEAKE
jgi:hypothetical protein